MAVLGKITAELLKDRGIQALCSDSSGLSPRGKLGCPKETSAYRSRRETTRLKPVTKVIERLFLDSRGVDLTRAYNPIFVTISS